MSTGRSPLVHAFLAAFAVLGIVGLLIAALAVVVLALSVTPY